MSLSFLHKYRTPMLLFFRFPSPSFLCLSLEKLEQCRFQGRRFKRTNVIIRFMKPALRLMKCNNSHPSLSRPTQSIQTRAWKDRAGPVYSFDERKERKKISNQESARRARWRKKKHLERLTDEAKRLSVENLELKKELGFVANKWQAVCRENDLLI